MTLSTINPFEHACDLSELDYTLVADGYICCTECSREWRLHPIDQGAIWINSAQGRMPGAHGRDFWTRDLKPYPKPTAEEIMANRQKRLDMLDQIARETGQRIEDDQRALTWLQRERARAGVKVIDLGGMLNAKQSSTFTVRLVIRFRDTGRLSKLLSKMSR